MSAPDVQERARALADPTRFRILTFLETAADPLGVAELTAHVGVHHNAVRRHLATLRDAGLVVEETAPTRGRGRPALRYRPVPGATDSWTGSSPYRDLAMMLLTLLRDGGTPREAGAAAGVALVAARPPRTDVDAVAAIEATARRLGFEPRREARPDGVDIVLDRCPFADLAAVAPDVVCALHRGLAEGIAAAVPGDVTVTGLDVRPPDRAGCRIELAAPAA